MTIFLPGDQIPNDDPNLLLLESQPDQAKAQVASVSVDLPVLPFSRGLLSLSRIYFPRVDDVVIAVVTKAHSEGYRLDINAPFEANLGTTDFNHATKLNRPKLQIGCVVLCRVSWTGCLNKESATSPSPCFHSLELNDSCDVTCEVPTDPRSWSTGEVYLGELSRNEGYFFQIPISQATSLQGEDNYLLQRLGQEIRYEIAIGANGRVWVKSSTPRDTMWIARIIQSGLGLTLAQLECKIRKMVEGQQRAMSE